MPLSYNKILCVGDSHASNKFTPTPWPDHLAKILDCEHDVLSSPGAGSQIGVDKLVLKLSNNSYDLVVFQLSHEYRNAIGMNYEQRFDKSNENDPWDQSGNKVGEEFIMCLNPSNNVGAMKKFFRGYKAMKRLFESFNAWYIQFVADNTYELYIKQLQQIYNIQKVCADHNTPCLIFAWHPIKQKKKNSPLFDSWRSMINWEDVINISAEQLMEQQEMKQPYEQYKATPVNKEWSVDGYHLNDQGSKWLVENLLIPYILK